MKAYLLLKIYYGINQRSLLIAFIAKNMLLISFGNGHYCSIFLQFQIKNSRKIEEYNWIKLIFIVLAFVEFSPLLSYQISKSFIANFKKLPNLIHEYSKKVAFSYFIIINRILKNFQIKNDLLNFVKIILSTFLIINLYLSQYHKIYYDLLKYFFHNIFI